MFFSILNNVTSYKLNIKEIFGDFISFCCNALNIITKNNIK